MQNFESYSLSQLSSEMRGIGFQPLSEEQINQINQLFVDYAKLSIEGKE